MRRNRCCFVYLLAISLAVLSLADVTKRPYHLLYNPTDSAPRGWYAVVPIKHIRVDDFVVVHLYGLAAQLAADRQYLPHTVPLLKQVAAISGQQVCEIDGSVTINHALVAHARRVDGAGRSLEAWVGCRALTSDELFLLSRDNDASFDSRYFGPVRRSFVRGRAIPVWTW